MLFSAENWYLQFIRVYPHLNDVITKTRESVPSQGNLHDLSMESSNSSNEIVDKFLCDYKGKKNFSRSVKTQENLYKVLGPEGAIVDQSMKDSVQNFCYNRLDIAHREDIESEKSVLTLEKDVDNILLEKQMLPGVGETTFSADMDRAIYFSEGFETIPASFNHSLQENKLSSDNIIFPDKVTDIHSEIKIVDEDSNVLADLNLDEIVSNIPTDTTDVDTVKENNASEFFNDTSDPVVDKKLEVELSNHTDLANNFLDPSVVNIIMQISESTTNNEENSCLISNLKENNDLGNEHYLDQKKNSDRRCTSPLRVDHISPTDSRESTSENRPREVANQDNFENSSLESGSYVSCVSPSHYEVTALNSDTTVKCDDCCDGPENSCDRATMDAKIEKKDTYFKESTVEFVDATADENLTNSEETETQKNTFDNPLLEKHETNPLDVSALGANGFNDQNDDAPIAKENYVDHTELVKNTVDDSNYQNDDSLNITNKVKRNNENDTRSTDCRFHENAHELDSSKNDLCRIATNDIGESTNNSEGTNNNSDLGNNNSGLKSSNPSVSEEIAKSDMEKSFIDTLGKDEQSELTNSPNRPKSLNSAPTLKRKISETVVENGNHTPRKKIKMAKTKSRKTVTSSRANKPKKSIYLYKLKSYSGSELHFTSPTSVTFIKPVITLTKLDEKKYLNSPNDELSPQAQEPCTQEPPIASSSSHTSPEPSLMKNEENVDVSLKKESSVEMKSDSFAKNSTPLENDEKVNHSLKEESAVEKRTIFTAENSTPAFTMQTRKKRLKFLPDGTLVTPKQELAAESSSPSHETKNSKKRSFRRNASLQHLSQSVEKKSKTASDNRNISKPSPKEAKSVESQIKKVEIKPSVQGSSKYIPKQNTQYKKPQKIFDYDSYYREKSNMEDNDQAEKNVLPTPNKKHKVAVALSRVKSISQSAKSGELVVNPAQLLSCLLGTPITQDQIRTVRFKPSTKKQASYNQVRITPSKLTSENSTIKPVAKRQLELLRNAPLDIFPKENDRTITQQPCELSKSSENHEIRNSS